MFINNEFVDAKSGKTFTTINPSTGKPLAEVAEGDQQDIEVAYQAAAKAFARGSVWRNLDASARGLLLLRLAELIERDASIISNIESLDTGKPIAIAHFDITVAISIFRYYAGYADKIHGKTIPADYGLYSMTRLEPVGVVGQIIPWNVPVLSLAVKWGPAIAAGCTLILKPAELTPLSALYVAALSKEAGFPDGVINVVNGYGATAGHAIAAHPKIAKVSFTGSVVVGKLIMETAAKTNLKRVSLELGGKSPLVIFGDADVEEAAKIAHDTIFANSGQLCIAPSRTFVHEDIYDEFVRRSVELAKQRKVGNPIDANVEQGPQIDERMMNKVLGYIESGKLEGAKLETGGKRIGNSGFFIEPTVFSNVTDDLKIAREEVSLVFGKVTLIVSHFIVVLDFRSSSIVVQVQDSGRSARTGKSYQLWACGWRNYQRFEYSTCFCQGNRGRQCLGEQLWIGYSTNTVRWI